MNVLTNDEAHNHDGSYRKIAGRPRLFTFDTSMMWYLILLPLVQLTDAVMTQILVGNGLAREGNPLMRELVGSGQFILFKLGVIIISCIVLWQLYKIFPRVTKIAALTIICFYCVVLWSNVVTAFHAG
jgi:hypothetical protein